MIKQFDLEKHIDNNLKIMSEYNAGETVMKIHLPEKKLYVLITLRTEEEQALIEKYIEDKGE
jgi:hypothetical protein